jgi:hypothetical protein
MFEKIFIKEDKSAIFGMIRRIITLILLIIFFILGFSAGIYFEKNLSKFFPEKPLKVFTVENPMKEIIQKNTNTNGTFDSQNAVREGIADFNTNYVNYLLSAFEVGRLHKSSIGFGNPVLELRLDSDVWSSEIIKGSPETKKKSAKEPDLIITLSKEEATKAIISNDTKLFIRESINSDRTKIEITGGKAELFSKGYLEMYVTVTGKEFKI